MAKIYLSSSYQDLVACREAVYRTLRKVRHDVLSMEDYPASDERPVDKCLADVAACDLYVGIFAWRSGYRPPGQACSITELELREAKRTGKPCLVFLLGDDAPWPPKFVDPDRSEIDRLRAELQRDHVVVWFRTPDDLAASVGAAVASWVQQSGADSARPGGLGAQDDDPAALRFYKTCLARITRELSNQIRFYRLASAAVVAAGAAIVALAFAFTEELVKPVVGVGGALVSATSVFPVATLLTTRKKKALLDGYEAELAKTDPARAAVEAVRRFLDRQV